MQNEGRIDEKQRSRAKDQVTPFGGLVCVLITLPSTFHPESSSRPALPPISDDKAMFLLAILVLVEFNDSCFASQYLRDRSYPPSITDVLVIIPTKRENFYETNRTPANQIRRTRDNRMHARKNEQNKYKPWRAYFHADI
ncbi:hypothetical protein PGT21_023067 [Puccinia graminis f. sp. tritici]|uniref:Uncharacterized protein n=1 Tax=Puccinia graminis f. sp. tritici TaxID=56615 RepID=A0A5B0NQZ4_PUCGR|nr:hypothetical protein PGT21_023067 [Puccinia graminis f. sp. tritici]